MITEKDLQDAIAECQGVRNPNANTCMKLAAYYIIKDNMSRQKSAPQVQVSQKAREMPAYSYSAPPSRQEVGHLGGSEFSRVVADKDIDHVLSVMDELMDTLNMVNPRLYEGVMAKLLR